MDPDYELYLTGGNIFQRTDADTEDNEPQYEIFLTSLKQNGDVWIVQADERNGLHENHCMEVVSDDVQDQDIRREMINVIAENVEDLRSNSDCPDVIGNLGKKQRKTMVENSMELPCYDPIYPKHIQADLDEDPATILSYASSMQHNIEQLGRSKKNRNGKNVRTSAKFTKVGDYDSSRNLRNSDSDYRLFLEHFVNDEDGVIRRNGAVSSIKGSPKPMAVPGRSYGDEDEDDGCTLLDTPGGERNSPFRDQLMKILRKPYDTKERRRLARDMKATRPIERNLDLRHGREQSYLTNKKGKSYLDYYPDLKRKLEAAADCHQELALLRGFFFWLQNLTQEGAFRPWQDKLCLALLLEDC